MQNEEFVACEVCRDFGNPWAHLECKEALQCDISHIGEVSYKGKNTKVSQVTTFQKRIRRPKN